jgi:hypothetical protein
MIFQKNYFILCYYFLFFIYVNGDIITNECSDSIFEGLIFRGNSSNENITFFLSKTCLYLCFVELWIFVIC